MTNISIDPNIPELNRKDQWVFYGLLVLVFWLPLPLASNRIWAIGILATMVLLLCASAAFAWRRNAGVALGMLSKFSFPVGLFGLFVGFSFLQVMPMPAGWLAVLSPNSLKIQQAAGLTTTGFPLHLSLDVYQSRIMASLSFAYFLVFVLVLFLVRDAKRLDRFAQVLVWSGLFQAMSGIFLFSLGAHYRLFFSELIHDNVIGTFVNRNHFAGYMEMTLAIGIGLMLARLGNSGSSYSGWRQRLVAALAFLISPKMRLRMMLVVMVIALVLTRSRMGNTAFFASMLIVGLISIPLSRRAAPATIALILSLVIVDVVIIGTWVGLEKVVSRINETKIVASEEGAEGTSIEERTLPALYTLEIIHEFPVFGAGAGSFYNVFKKYQPPEISGDWNHAHNDYAEIASDFGLLGAVLLAILVLSTFAISIKVLYQRRASLPRGIAFGALMSMVALAIHSSVDFNLQIPANALTFVVILALAWAAAKLPSQRRVP